MAGSLRSQTDVGLSPVALLFGGLKASVEGGLNDHWGLDGDILIAEDVLLLTFAGKHYFNAKEGLDGFNAGVFVGGGPDIGGGLGFLAGYKVISQKKIFFEVSLGLGRGFGDLEFIPYGKLNIGYRFVRKQKD
ncbi:MAG: hypothetical protein MI974_11085 [Chitinophagales bacterium]|nr:hypothetical protein [Chitinophagales bacterium]